MIRSPAPTSDGAKVFVGLIVFAGVLGLIVGMGRIILAIYLFVWEISGFESVKISPLSIKVDRRILGLLRTKEYESENITSVRVAEILTFPFAFTKFKFTSFEVPYLGPIALTYKGKIIRIGLGLDQESGRTVVAAIHQRFPQYSK